MEQIERDSSRNGLGGGRGEGERELGKKEEEGEEEEELVVKEEMKFEGGTLSNR